MPGPKRREDLNNAPIYQALRNARNRVSQYERLLKEARQEREELVRVAIAHDAGLRATCRTSGISHTHVYRILSKTP